MKFRQFQDKFGMADNVSLAERECWEYNSGSYSPWPYVVLRSETCVVIKYEIYVVIVLMSSPWTYVVLRYETCVVLTPELILY